MPAEFTVDCESDWGGRNSSIYGIQEGVPILLKDFKKYNLKVVFFLSTEHLDRYLTIAKEILYNGHTIGSHGHKHLNWKKNPGWYDDFLKSCDEIKKKLGISIDLSKYRAPWFSQHNCMDYDHPRNHVSVLKHAWFKQMIPEHPIFYIHPFDIIEPKTQAPDLFCKLIYSRPRKVYETFHKLLQESF